jgi:TolB protein
MIWGNLEPAPAQEDSTSSGSARLWEVFLSSRVALSNRVPLHYLGMVVSDSTTSSALDTLEGVLVRDLTLCGLFNLRLPSFPVDTTAEGSPREATTYFEGEFQSAGESFLTRMQLAGQFGAEPFWSSNYEYGEEQARAAAHRISADVIRQLTGEPSVMQTRIAFIGQANGAKEIYSTTFDGFDLRKHTAQENTILSPAWSPDGLQIAYTSFLQDQADIYVMNLEDETYVPFVNWPGVDQAPDWSRNGQWIAYSSSVDGNSEIYVRNVDGSQLKRLTYSWAIETSPSWSPTGHQIAFTSDRLGRPQVFVMDASGTNQRRLTTEGNYNDSPAWSPKGDLVAYVRRGDDGFQIYVTDPQGNNHVKLTEGPGDNLDPCWSPDGLRIAFTSNRLGLKQIYVMDVFGRNVERVSSLWMSCSNPTWSPILEKGDEVRVSTGSLDIENP